MHHKIIFFLFLACLQLFPACLADEFAFFDACEAGDAAAIIETLEAGSVGVNYSDENGFTPLILATKSGHIDAMNALLDHGADIELAADYPAPVDTPLSAAAQSAQLQAMELLLSRGAQVDGRGRDGRTALISAAAKGELEAVNWLLDEAKPRADVNALKLDGTSALSWAASGAFEEVVLRLLTEGASVDVRDLFDGSQPIHFACHGSPGFRGDGEAEEREGGPEEAATGVSTPPASGSSSEGGSGSSKRSTRRTLNHLLTFGAQPGARTGVTGPRDPATGALKPDPKREELMGGRTPLHVAAAEGNLAALRLLLGMITSSTGSGRGSGGGGSGEEEAVDVDAVDVQGLSAVALAAMQGHRKALELLLGQGQARPDTPALDARSPLHHAAFHGHPECAKLLVKHGTRVDQPSALTNGNGPGQTPLLVASFQGNLKVVKTLLKLGANPNAAAKDGATPLIAGASGGHRKVVKALLKAGGDPRRRLESGETAAVLTRNREVAKLLYIAEYDLRASEAEAAAAASAGDAMPSDDEHGGREVEGEGAVDLDFAEDLDLNEDDDEDDDEDDAVDARMSELFEQHLLKERDEL